MKTSALASPLILILLLGACSGPKKHGPEEWREWADDRGGEAPGEPAWMDVQRQAGVGAYALVPASGGAAPLQSARGSVAASLRHELAQTRLRGFVVQDEESLRAVVESVQATTGLPLVVHPAAEDAALDEGAVFQFDLQNSISVENVLDLIVEQAGEEVTWIVRHDVVLVTTRDRAGGTTFLLMHDVQDLVAGRTDFIGPRLDRLRLLDEMEDDDGGGPFGGVGELVIHWEEDDVATLVQENIAPQSWEGDHVSITAENGFLAVVQTREVHALIRDFLNALRGF